MQRAPTIHDLRVKSCYICCEEEVYDQPKTSTETPKRWVHPCKCTLIAHEQCLLEWIRSSENNPDKAASSILKCPQCKSQYTLKSNYPLSLRVLDVVAALIRLGDHIGTAFTIVSGVVSVSAGAYITLTACGAYSVRRFIGPEMFRLVFGDDVERWPIRAYFTLPLIPLSLILGRTKKFRYTLPLYPLMMFWPSVAKYRDRTGRLVDNFFYPFGGFGPNNPVPRWALPKKFRTAYPSTIFIDTVQDVFFSWPPSPFMFQFIFFAVRRRYNEYMERLRQYVLGDDIEGKDTSNERGFFPFNFQVEMAVVDEEEAPEPEDREVRHDGIVDDNNNVRLVLDNDAEAPQGEVAHEEADAHEHRQRIVYEVDDAGWGALAIDRPQPIPEDHLLPDNDRIVDDPEPEQENQHNENIENANGNANANNIGNVNANQAANENRNQNQNQNAPNNGDLRVRLTGRLIGHLVGGALVIPTVASLAGMALLKLALPAGPFAHQHLDFTGYPLYSPRRLLCTFLGIRPPNCARKYSTTRLYAFHPDMSNWQIATSVFGLATRTLLVGTPAWAESDPVWWRNTIGLSLCYVAKDLLTIWYSYLSKRELKSRKLMNRPFTDIDPTELDLTLEARERYSQGFQN